MPTAASTQIEKGKWPLESLPSRAEQANYIALREQDKPDVTCYPHIREINKKNTHLLSYGIVLMASESPGVKQTPHDGDNQVVVLVDCGVGNNFDDQPFSQLEHRLLDGVDLSVPSNILTAGRSLLDGTK